MLFVRLLIFFKSKLNEEIRKPPLSKGRWQVKRCSRRFDERVACLEFQIVNNVFIDRLRPFCLAFARHLPLRRGDFQKFSSLVKNSKRSKMLAVKIMNCGEKISKDEKRPLARDTCCYSFTPKKRKISARKSRFSTKRSLFTVLSNVKK